jgi:hypothetical protein
VLHRVRDRVVACRTRVINQLRALLLNADSRPEQGYDIFGSVLINAVYKLNNWIH